jgi:hypothetical protein
MQAIMNRKELVDKLDLVGQALADNNSVPVFQCFSFTGTHVLAYNDALAIVAPCKTPDVFAVNGQVLLGLLKASMAEIVEFKLDGGSLIVQAGRSTFKLPFFTKDEFLFEEPAIKGFAYNLSQHLVEGVSACLLTSSKDNAQPAFMGVSFNQGRLYSTDGDAITRFSVDPDDVASAKGAPRMVPNLFCQAVVKTAEATIAEDLSTGALSIADEWAVAKMASGYSIYGRLIPLDQPLDHEAEITKTIKSSRMSVPIPKGLDNCLARARVVADAESAKTVLTVEAKRLKLLTDTPMGVVRDSVPFADHADVTANVSAQLIERCIKLCNHMAVLPNCVVFKGERLLIVTANMGD